MEGNKRFIQGMPIHKDYKQQIIATAKSQHPIAVVLSCIDSRVPVETIFDMSFGDIFCVRVAGNVVSCALLVAMAVAMWYWRPLSRRHMCAVEIELAIAVLMLLLSGLMTALSWLESETPPPWMPFLF